MADQNDELCVYHRRIGPRTARPNELCHFEKGSTCPLVGDANLLLVLPVLHWYRAYTPKQGFRVLRRKTSFCFSQQDPAFDRMEKIAPLHLRHGLQADPWVRTVVL